VDEHEPGGSTGGDAWPTAARVTAVTAGSDARGGAGTIAGDPGTIACEVAGTDEMAELMSFEDRLARFGSGVYRELRDAQAHILHEYAERHRDRSDVGIELPTGLSKTLVTFLIADEALDRGRSVAYLTGTKQLAEQVADQARQLGELEVACFRSRHYPAADLQNYHQAEAIGIMNYWVYFNSRPVPQPADLVIFDDAHIASSRSPASS
jgi:RAD3-like DEAD/DEAH box helicase